jgi:hypothetical protein
MATPRKKPTDKTSATKKSAPKTPTKKVSKVKDDYLTPLDIHAIQLHELFLSLRKAGFPEDITIGLITDKGAYPEWFATLVPDLELLEEEEEED